MWRVLLREMVWPPRSEGLPTGGLTKARSNWSGSSRRLHKAQTTATRCGKLVVDLAVARRLAERRPSFQAQSTLGHYVSFQSGYAFESAWYATNGVRVARNQNVGHGALDWNEERRIGHERATEFDRFALNEGDILLSLDRPIIKTGLKIARVSTADLPALLLQRVARPRYKAASLSPDYLYLWMRSSAFRAGINPGRSAGVPHISTRELERLPIEIPSLEEQADIVGVVDRLLYILADLQAGVSVLARQRKHWLGPFRGPLASSPWRNEAFHLGCNSSIA